MSDETRDDRPSSEAAAVGRIRGLIDELRSELRTTLASLDGIAAVMDADPTGADLDRTYDMLVACGAAWRATTADAVQQAVNSIAATMRRGRPGVPPGTN